VIVNASLAGVAPDSAYNEAAEFLSGVVFAGVAPAEDRFPGQASSLKKIVSVELLRDCECVPRRVGQTRLATSCRNFRAALVSH
jgi:hypothetical protein